MCNLTYLNLTRKILKRFGHFDSCFNSKSSISIHISKLGIDARLVTVNAYLFKPFPYDVLLNYTNSLSDNNNNIYQQMH
jgi:hypothetical protein